jgi:hypothetical protein
MHVHVLGADGRAKIWIEPAVELAYNHGLRDSTLGTALALIRERENEIRTRGGRPRRNPPYAAGAAIAAWGGFIVSMR